MKITVYGHTSHTARLAEIALFVRQLGASQLHTEIWSGFYDYLRQYSALPANMVCVDAPSADSDMVLTLGGDGTLLHAAAWCGNRRIPLLGVNTGHLGFLTCYTISESHLLLDDLTAGTLVAEKRTLLHLESLDADAPLPADLWPYALNEVALLKAESASMISVRTDTDSGYVTDYSADGLIIATPTGSTGYNLSAGGPIIEPTLDCLALTPIAPHSLSIRPLVITSDSRITALTTSRQGSYRVALDGRSFTMRSGTRLTVKTAENPLMLMRRRNVSFAATLRSKLHWGKAEKA